jgi:hypothetical protein
VQGVVRPCEVADRDQEFVHLGVARRDPVQSRYVKWTAEEASDLLARHGLTAPGRWEAVLRAGVDDAASSGCWNIRR